MTDADVRFEAAWLAARATYDEAALAPDAVAAIQAWGARFPAGRPIVVVDLGSGTGAALGRARRWLAPHPLATYAVDRDSDLLARAQASLGGLASVTPVVGDLLSPLERWGGPPDGTVDLVLGHALADLVPLDRLAGRSAVLLRPGGLVHLALAYDGQTAFIPSADPGLDAAMVTAFHRHMDRYAVLDPAHGGSTAGRRLAPALAAAGLEIVVDAPSTWCVRAGDGAPGRSVLSRLLRFVCEAAQEMGDVPSGDLERWEQQRRAALADGTLAVTVGHRDVLARSPGPSRAACGNRSRPLRR